MKTLICKKCKQEKEISFFQKRYDGKGIGYRYICKECYSIWKKEYRKRKHVKKKETEYRKEYYSKHKEYSKKKCYEWRNKNKKRYLLLAKRDRDKRRSTIDGKLKHSISRNILKSLKEDKNGKNWEEIVGYTLSDLKECLMKNFEDWMSWDNYGGNAGDERKTWWIDHIKPVSLFDFFDETQIKECWSLENLRPLEKIENIKKGNIYYD